ncbi:MAG: GTP cyclohydrolase, FolE2/MptA family, partial [Allgaiera sp.]|nr:GTP cyclohydrolase, FolE2/MptA family [Allgaiera sp.]
MNMRIDAPQDEANKAADALETLKTWLETAPKAERAARAAELAALTGTVLSRDYDRAFTVDAAYRDSLPDLQNGPASLIRGQNRRIQHVGISNFRLPLRHPTRGGAPLLLETSVTGTVSLEAEKKGINMSRILRSFYAHAEKQMGRDVVEAALDDYKRDLGSFDARIALRFSFPMQVASLRSGLTGYQYYDVTLELAETGGQSGGQRTAALHLDYVYSSTCPCSLELSEHARASRGQLATPHSQRSVARLSVALTEAPLAIEDLVELCRVAVPTETQVM